jgi:hypothetical protein
MFLRKNELEEASYSLRFQLLKPKASTKNSSHCYTDFLSVRKKGTVWRPKQALIKSLVAGGGLVV